MGYNQMPEINPHIYLVFDKGAQRHVREKTVCSISCVGKVDIHRQKTATRPLLLTLHKKLILNRLKISMSRLEWGTATGNT
jgi:hypothetical protein